MLRSAVARWRTLLLALVMVGGLVVVLPASPASAADPCAPVVSPVACENTLPGTPQSVWGVTGGGDPTIQGFASDISVNVGARIDFKISTPASAYTVKIYRLGYYNGDGARELATVTPSATLPQTQPACLNDNATGLTDCGNWGVSASWNVPANAVSGLYLAHLIRNDTGGDSHIPFVVRNDASHSAVLLKTSDSTWQAYNRYGQGSFYVANNNAGRAFKVSYNRPITLGQYGEGQNWIFNAEYPMLQFIERNGYDVSYTTDVDSARRGNLIQNHKIFVSSGHDEYWSGPERANVEAARDAGVNLAFFSGNEVYWKTRWEPSIDGSATDFRTLVCYKETRDNAKTDPSATWTGTWRDTRFSPPADGGRPENSLTGTLWTVNAGTFDMQVPAADGKMRLWRNTAIASLAPGATATLAPNSLGYEWDEDVDNGSRPAGQIWLSTTSAQPSARILDAYGNVTGPGPATHHLTMYKAASGALVFSAGSVQFAYNIAAGSGQGTEDVRVQQAVINLFADMGVQPVTLATGLVAATKSADVTAPSVTITSPLAGTTRAHGSALTVTGTATDAGGGVVGGVEVSVDGGVTWHPATGRESWSYTTTAVGTGTVGIKARATDDSANLGAVATVNTTVNCPCSVFPTTQAPVTAAANDSSGVELGMRFRSTTAGFITGVRFYKGTGNTGTHTGTLWSASGTQLATVTFAGETATGWQSASFPAPVSVTANTTYVISYRAPSGHYAADPWSFQNANTSGSPLYALRDGLDGPSGAYATNGFPNSGFQSTNYWVDAVFTAVVGPDVTPPTVAGRSPAPGTLNADAASPVVATFSESVQPATAVLTVKTTNGGVAVAGSTATNGAAVTFTPTLPLASGTGYTVTVSGAKDLAGNVQVGTDTWTFSTATAAGCPCTVWPSSATPTTAAANDGAAIEVGTKVRADVNGWVTGIRFYKGTGNTGTHLGHLWTSAGALLATVTFSGETATGWQQALLDTPVAVTAGTTYVVSYFAPAGHYGYDPGYFASSGAGSAPIRALANGVDGGNGVYVYGANPTFPSATFGSTNYWVDAVFSTTPPAADVTPPTVTSTFPTAGQTGVSVGAAPSATFSEAVQPATITFGVTGPGGAVAGTASYDGASRTATFTPAAGLVAGSAYTATVSGVKDLAGNVLAAPVSWSFTVAVAACPCSAFGANDTPASTSASDAAKISVGVRFTPDQNGFITGVKFYKGVGNTGTHVGRLWSSTGTLLASATFSGESASGWQTVSFAGSVAVTKGTTYVASYYAPAGHYAVTANYFTNNSVDRSPLHLPATAVGAANGLYVYGSNAFPTQSFQGANYWVDVVMTIAGSGDVTPPTVTAKAPAAGATGVDPAATVSASFSEAVDTGTGTLSVTGPGGAAVAGTQAYDVTGQTLTFTPAAQLTAGATFTATVAGAKDLAGNVLAAPVVWTFTTAVPACPCSIFPGSATPRTASASDTSSVELGVKFRADVNGSITAVKFYKGAANTGTHVGTLWTSAGVALASGTFSAETATGWQTLTFAAPVPVTAGTTYVASYLAPAGGYAFDGGYFSTAGSPTAPVRALADGLDGGNGVFRYGGHAFPNNSGAGSNYWVDVVFTHP